MQRTAHDAHRFFTTTWHCDTWQESYLGYELDTWHSYLGYEFDTWHATYLRVLL